WIGRLGKGKNQIGSQTGAAYAWNTIGALAGSLAGGFGFIPMFSAPGVWELVTVLLATLALVSAWMALAQRLANWRNALFPIATAGVAVGICAATGPTAFWRHSEFGVVRVAVFYSLRNDVLV